MKKEFAILNLYLPMRGQVLDVLEDIDLDFKPEALPSIGETCLQLGEWQMAYIIGFKTFEQNFDYRNTDQEMRKSVKGLRAWYQQMDQDIEKAIAGISAEDIENKGINRGDWEASVAWNLRIWQECLIIFYTKMMHYFKLMGKKVPDGLVKWIE